MTETPSNLVPASRGELTAGWIAEALARTGAVPRGESIDFESRPIGADRGFTGELALVSWRSASASGTLIAKLPDAAQPFDRCEREVRFYEHIGADAGVPVPTMIHGAVDAASSRVAILLEVARGRDGDAAVGCTAREASLLLEGLARMHARWWRRPGLDRLTWLPRWGQGEAGTVRPHRRRAERFRKRIGPFLEKFGDGAPADLVRQIESLADPCEEIVASLANLPATLIHGDLHLDNVIFTDQADDGGFVLLDWQSVSAGPGLYDLSRLLCGSVDETAEPGAAAALARRYRELLAGSGVDLGPPAAFDGELRAMLLSVLVGFVSGYGGREPATMRPRERAMIERDVSPHGLGGVVLALTGGRVEPAPAGSHA